MTDYVLRELKNTADVVSVVRDMVVPNDDFAKKHMPKDLTDKQKRSDAQIQIQQQRIKLYANREAEVTNNMNKIYGIVKTQCSYSLKIVLEQEKEFDEKNKDQDIVWLLERLKEITSCLDMKSNKTCNLFDAALAFLTMRQGEKEGDSLCLKRFRIILKRYTPLKEDTCCAAKI